MKHARSCRKTLDKLWNPSGYKRESRSFEWEFNSSRREAGGCHASRVNSVLAIEVRFPETTGFVSVIPT
jgi:hypothetical protein